MILNLNDDNEFPISYKNRHSDFGNTIDPPGVGWVGLLGRGYWLKEDEMGLCGGQQTIKGICVFLLK